MIRNCPDCKKNFETKLSRQKKCDTCKYNTCETCGFKYRPNHYASKYCSNACKDMSLKGIDPIIRMKKRGIKPRTYLKNHRDKHGSAEDMEWRSKVFERDNFTCQNCGQHGGKLQADHMKSVAAYPELRHEVSNGRTLCVPCHQKTPNYGYKAVKEIAARRMRQEVLI